MSKEEFRSTHLKKSSSQLDLVNLSYCQVCSDRAKRADSMTGPVNFLKHKKLLYFEHKIGAKRHMEATSSGPDNLEFGK